MKRKSSADKLLNYRYEENKLRSWMHPYWAASLAATILNAAQVYHNRHASLLKGHNRWVKVKYARERH